MSEILRILDQDGNLVGEAPDLSNEQLLELFSWVVKTRAFDQKAVALRRQGRIGEYYGSEGQEAVVGAGYALGDNDWVISAYREEGAWFTKGLPFEAVLGVYKGLPALSWDSATHKVTRMNATIATHLPHAVGKAYAARLKGEDMVTMGFFGDGATSESDFHAAMNFAGVWKAPTVFLCQNNLYAQSVPIEYQTAGIIADKALGYGFPGVRVDGMDPLAVYTAATAAIERARAGEGPTLIEMLTYRFHGHATYEANPLNYRPEGEHLEWLPKDPIIRMRNYLTTLGILEDGYEESLIESVNAECEEAVARLESQGLPDSDFAVRSTYKSIPKDVAAHYNTVRVDRGEEPYEFSADELFEPEAELPIPDGPTETITHVEAIRRALLHKMEEDPHMVCVGEDIGIDGGPFKATGDFYEMFGRDRVLDSPLSETGIIGTAVGMAMEGVRVMAEIQFAGFVYASFDQVVGHVAKMRWRYQDEINMPIVIRMPGGTGFHGHEFHMDKPEALFMHMPGIQILAPTDPVEAKGLMAAALESEDPVMFFEPISLYRTQKAEVPTDHYTIPIGRAKVMTEGSDVTVVTYGERVHDAVKAAKLAEKDGISVEVINLRTIRPWDQETVFASVEKTGRLVTVHDAHRAAGVGAEIAARVAEELIYSLEGPVVRVAGFDAHRPIGGAEDLAKIDAKAILGGIRRSYGLRRN